MAGDSKGNSRRGFAGMSVEKRKAAGRKGGLASRKGRLDNQTQSQNIRSQSVQSRDEDLTDIDLGE